MIFFSHTEISKISGFPVRKAKSMAELRRKKLRLKTVFETKGYKEVEDQSGVRWSLPDRESFTNPLI